MNNMDKVITDQEAEELGLEASGDCYSRAVSLLLEFPMFKFSPPEELFLCHGRPRSTNPHPALLGRPFDHAWVEFRHPDGPAMCLDGVDTGEETAFAFIEKEVYYKVGRVDPDTVRRYSKAETLKMLATNLTYGPWEDLSTSIKPN